MHFSTMNLGEALWLGTGFFAQFLFSCRFLVQWIASERAKQSLMPMSFWYFSIGGGAMLLAYAIHQRDPVFILGQSTGLIIYIRNVMLRRREALALHAADSSA